MKNRYHIVITLLLIICTACHTSTEKQVIGAWTWKRIAIDSNHNGMADPAEWVPVSDIHLYGAVRFNADKTGYTILSVSSPDTSRFTWHMSEDNMAIITTDTGLGSNPSTARIDTLNAHLLVIKEEYNNSFIWTAMTK